MLTAICVATISNIDTTMGWYYISCMLCGKKVKSQSRSFWCAKCETNTNLPISRLETHTLTTKFEFSFYKHIHLTIITKQLQNTSYTGFKLKSLIQLTRQLLSYLIEMLRNPK